jgi:hypothetical protein
MTRMSDTELCAGRRADFHVYYRRGGKLFFDPMWAKTPEEAAAKMLGFARELRMGKIEIVRVVPVASDA